MPATPSHSSARIASLVFVLTCFASTVHGFGAEAVDSFKPAVATNYVLVTNTVVLTLTNYVVITNTVLGTNSLAADRTNSSVPDLNWIPPEDGFDWVQLKSGEWLKGRVKAMQNRQLEFDSEELDVQTFDWEDIRRLRSPRVIDVRFLDGEGASGPITVTPERVEVSGAQSRVVSRGEVLGLTPGGSRELNYWSGKASVGLSLREGNSKSVDYNAQAHLQRRSPATRLSLDYIGNVSSVDAVESANNHRVNSEFDVWLSRRLYLVVPFVEYYKDPFQNLAHRVTAGVGVGYDLVDRPNLEWNITTGPAYQQAWFDSSQPGEPTEKGTGALVFGSRFDWDVTQRIELILEYRGQYTSPKVGETTHHGVATLSLELTKRFNLDVSIVWDRISNPKVGASGVQPKPDDFRLIVGLGVDF